MHDIHSHYMLPHTWEGAFIQTAIESVSVMFHIKSDYAASKQASKRVMYAIVELSKLMFI